MHGVSYRLYSCPLTTFFLSSHFNPVAMVTANGSWAGFRQYICLTYPLISSISLLSLNILFALWSCPEFQGPLWDSDTYQGIMRPMLVHLLRLTRKPTVGSVTASQARPTNRMIEAWEGSSYRQNVEKEWGMTRKQRGCQILPHMVLLGNDSQEPGHQRGYETLWGSEDNSSEIHNCAICLRTK